MFILFTAFQLRQMLAHSRKRKAFTITTVILHRQRKEVIPNNTTDIQVVVQTFQRFIMIKFMFCVSHEFSQFHRFNPD